MAKFVSRKKKRTTVIIAAIAIALIVIALLVAVIVAIPKANSTASTIHNLVIKELPKTKYLVGESASYDGLVIEAVYHSGEREIVDLDECTINGFNS